jgi:phage-related minor tail protein
MAGQASVVGEHGRELFVPSSAGRVLSVPQAKAAVGGGGGVVVNQTINVSTGVQQTVRNEIKSLMPQIADSAKAAVLDARRRGGSYGSAFG